MAVVAALVFDYFCGVIARPRHGLEAGDTLGPPHRGDSLKVAVSSSEARGCEVDAEPPRRGMALEVGGASWQSSKPVG